MVIKLIPICAALAATCFAAEAPFPDAVQLSGKWQPAVWATPENPKATRPKNVERAALARLPDDVSLTAAEPVKFTHLQWGDCRLQIEINGKASVRLMGVYDVVALSGHKAAGWA
ncbi:MAG: hypothetical protein GY953_57730, partial [bacterium]|nr:hypothetical protein [bacterium]